LSYFNFETNEDNKSVSSSNNKYFNFDTEKKKAANVKTKKSTPKQTPSSKTVQKATEKPSLGEAALPKGGSISQYNPSFADKLKNLFIPRRNLAGTLELPAVNELAESDFVQSLASSAAGQSEYANSIIGSAGNAFVDKVMGKSYEKAMERGELPYGIPKKPEKYIPKTTGGKIASFGGSFVGDAPLMPINLASNLLKAKTALNPIVREGITQGLTGGAIGTAQGLVNGESSSDVAKRAGAGLVLGGVLGSAATGLPKGIKALADNRIAKQADTLIPKLEINPLQDVQNAYKTPSLRDVRQQELEKLFGNTPVTERAGVQPSSPTEYFGNTANQADFENLFGSPIKKYSFKSKTQQMYEDLFNGKPVPENPGEYFGKISQADLEKIWGKPLKRYSITPRKELEYNTIFSGDDVFFSPQREAAKGNATPEMRFGESPTQSDYENLFGGPVNTYRRSNDVQNAIAEVEAQLDNMVNDIAASLRQADNVASGEKNILQQVRNMGGVAPSRTGALNAEYNEFVPIWLRNSNGRPLDEVADELGLTASQLMDEIRNPVNRVGGNKNYLNEAYLYAANQPEYQALEQTLRTLRESAPQTKSLDYKPKLRSREINKVEPITNSTPPLIQPLAKKVDTSSVKLEPRDLSRTRMGKARPLELRPREISATSVDNVNLGKTVKPGQEFIPRTSEGLQPEPRIWTNREGLPISELPRIEPLPKQEVKTLPTPEIPKQAEPFTGELPEPKNEVIIGKTKESFNFKDAFNKFYRRFVNTKQPTFDAGKTLNSDIGILASNTANVNNVVEYNLVKAMVDKEGNVVGKSLKEVAEKIPKGKEKDFWTYQSHLDNIDRARESKPLFFYEIAEGGTKKKIPYTSEMSAKMAAQIEKANPEFKAINDEITKWIDDLMQTWGVKEGTVNKELYQSLRETYKAYSPKNRELSELEKAIPDGVSQRFVDQKTPLKKAKGSDLNISDPLENIINLANRVIRTAKYNEVGQSLLKSVRENPAKAKQLAEIVPTKQGMTSTMDNIVTVLEDGKPIYLRINDKALLDSLKGLPKRINDIPYVTALSNVVKDTITGKNPLFGVANAFRDIPTSYVYGSESNPLKYVRNLTGAGKDILTNSSNYQKYQAVGGGGANFFNSKDTSTPAAELLRGNTGGIKGVAQSALDGLSWFNNAIETAPRLAEFNKILRETGDVNKALFGGSDVTVNFSRHGDVIKFFDKAGTLYGNAAVQGIDKFFRMHKDPKTALQTLAKAGVTITAPTVGFYMINRDNPNYQALDNRTKDTSYLIPNMTDLDRNGNAKTFIKIPKSREIGVLYGALFERLARMAEGQEDSFKGFSKSVATDFAPSSPIENNLLTPLLINVPRNKDFANRPIIPQSVESLGYSPYLQYDDRTTEPAKWFANLIKDVPMPEQVKKTIGSPKVIDYLVKSYTGIIGQVGIPLTTKGQNALSPVTRKFTSDPIFSNQATTDFYDKLDELKTKAADRNRLENIPSKDITPQEDIKNSMQGVGSAMSRGFKKASQIQASSSPNKEDEIKAIRKQILELAMQANKAKTSREMQLVEDRANKVFKK